MSAFMSELKKPANQKVKIINAILLGALAAALIVNQFILAKNQALAGVRAYNLLTKLNLKFNWGDSGELTGDSAQDAVKLALAQGAPEIQAPASAPAGRAWESRFDDQGEVGVEARPIKTEPAIGWTGSEPGGHHRSGILTFDAPDSIPKFFGLKMRDVGGIPWRTFEWSFD